MPVNGQELATLDFGNLIGGPLSAVVEAQAKSALRTTDFIKQVAFDRNGKLIDVDFTYSRRNDSGVDEDFTLTVPLLTMVPIPYIAIDEAIVEFNAKITSITQQQSMSDFANNTNVDAGGSWWFARAAMTSKTSYQRTSASSDKEERTFDMRVYVKARGTDMPSGTERLLTILENVIKERRGGPAGSLAGGLTGLKATRINMGASGTAAIIEVTFDKDIASAKPGWGVFESSGTAPKAWILEPIATGGKKAKVANAGTTTYDFDDAKTYGIRAVTELQDVTLTGDTNVTNGTDVALTFKLPVIAAQAGWKLYKNNTSVVIGTVVTPATAAAPTTLTLKPVISEQVLATQLCDFKSA